MADLYIGRQKRGSGSPGEMEKLRQSIRDDKGPSRSSGGKRRITRAKRK